MIRLAIRCRPEHAEIVLAELLELAPGGVEEDASNPGPPREVWGDDDGRASASNPESSSNPVDPGREMEEPTGIGGYVEYAIYGAPGELPSLPDLNAVVGDVPIEVETTEIPDDWADRWRDFHEPAMIAGGRLVVRPSWTESEGVATEEEISVVIDPGQAFGTGAHATTQLTLELLLELSDHTPERGALVDLGTGSAVIAIAAAKRGWGPVLGIDHEKAAVEAAHENARLNGVEISVERLNLRQNPPPSAPTITANLTAPLLKIVAAWMRDDPAIVPATLACSGLLVTESDEVVAAFAEAGMAVVERRAAGDWGALLLERE
ncbi:hypothetical protein BH10ACT11_BH10ACT11_08560 [soil metagenome]